MTKRWSSTKSMDGQTKRQASKGVRRAGNVILDPHDHAPPCGDLDDCPYPDCLVGGVCASLPNGDR